MLHADADLLTSGSTSYPPIDPIGPDGQWGHYTDEETRGSGASTSLALIGDNYYDPFTGRFVARKGGPGPNAYEAEILPTLAFVGTVEGAGNALASLGTGQPLG